MENLKLRCSDGYCENKNSKYFHKNACCLACEINDTCSIACGMVGYKEECNDSYPGDTDLCKDKCQHGKELCCADCEENKTCNALCHTFMNKLASSCDNKRGYNKRYE